MSEDGFSILLVEDNPSDVDLTLQVLRDGPTKPKVAVVGGGTEALRFLRREGEYTTATRPNFILLDLNIPGMHGTAVLEAIKSDPALMTIPVVVFTSSTDESEIVRAYALKASCYVSKPDDFEGYTRTMRALEQFWIGHVTYTRS